VTAYRGAADTRLPGLAFRPAPALEPRHGGGIVNVDSVNAFFGLVIDCGTAKAALLNLARALWG
jgi:NAD(P)-dependent dehydrogenase (short-subunit alcohol dehydrogenase family)